MPRTRLAPITSPRTAACAAMGLCALLIGCDRDRETALRADLSEYVYLTDTHYFDSRRTCTAAIFELSSSYLTGKVEPDATLEAAQATYDLGGPAAIQMADYSPNDMADGMLLLDRGVFGKQVLEAAANVGDCLTDEASAGFRTALTRPSAILIWLPDPEGFMIVDPGRDRAYYAAGFPL